MWGVKDMIYYGRDVCEDVCNALSCSMASSRTRYNALDSMVLVRNVITTIRMSMRQTSKDGMLEGYRNYAWMRACGNDMAKALASPPRNLSSQWLTTHLGFTHTPVTFLATYSYLGSSLMHRRTQSSKCWMPHSCRWTALLEMVRAFAFFVHIHNDNHSGEQRADHEVWICCSHINNVNPDMS